jgi:nucleoside-diphosphate-sugar epimerase
MTTLVVGASGATGRLLVEQLCNRGQNVRVIVRSPNQLPETLRNHDNLTAIYASILELSDVEMSQHVSGCFVPGTQHQLAGYFRLTTQACD